MKKITFGLAAALALPSGLLAQPSPGQVAQLRDAALHDDLAYQITEELTTEIGPRLAGTAAEKRAREWAVKRLSGLGFQNVRVEEFRLPVWVRGEETAEITAPFPQKLVLTALGNSPSTGPGGIEAEVVYFPTLDDLRAAPAGSLKGKIAFVSHAMAPTQDGSNYAMYGPARFVGANIASQKGAAALVIKSIGTDRHRNPHTGGTNFEDGVRPIPAAALSVPDAEQLVRIFQRGKPVRMKLTLTPRHTGQGISGNVIAEVPGRDPSAGIVLVACHLDSWDLGTGAIDDAAGCGIVAAAARRIMDAGQPRRTIRILWAGAEEVGVYGGEAYAKAHRGEYHALAAESDFGADRIWKVDVSFPATATPVADRIATALAPLGIVRGNDAAHGGADVEGVIAGGTAAVDLHQSGLRYFDLHHTPDDTLDKVRLDDMRQNVAAWTAMLAVAANAPETLGPVARKN